MRRCSNFLIVLLLLAVILLPASCDDATPNSDGTNRAAIIDQLFLLEPNPPFITEATRLLESAGFKVDVWQGVDITVDFYRKLPTLGYRFIVFRVHSGTLLEMKGDKVVELPNTYLFTAEKYTATRYVAEQLTDKVSNAMMEENIPLVFAVNSEFFRSTKGNFDHTVIMAMGCESYRYDDLPRAFMEKGASVYIGWSDVVSLEHVDKVTIDLLKKFCSDNLTITDGVDGTMADFGNDPYFKSYLKFYPEDSGRRTVKDLTE